MFVVLDAHNCDAVTQYLDTHSKDEDFKRACQRLALIAIEQDCPAALQLALDSLPNILMDIHILRAAGSGRVGVLPILLPHYDLNESLGQEVLAMAAKRGHDDVLRACKEYVCNDDSWFIALAQACMCGHKNCVPFLLTQANARLDYSRVLNLSLMYKHENIAQLLIEHDEQMGDEAYAVAQEQHFAENIPKLEALMEDVWQKRRLKQHLIRETAGPRQKSSRKI